MTHDERISSYIDNELSPEQEQEFLISLAASDGLRKSFRSELVMKKVLHEAERSANPPRRLRGAVFAAVGLAGAEMLSGEHAHAATSATRTTSAFKSLFATKISTLVTVATLGTTAIVGYGVRTATEPVTQHTATAVTAPVQPASTSITPAEAHLSTTENLHTASSAPTEHRASHQVQGHHQHAATVRHHINASSQDAAHVMDQRADPVSRVAGGGPIILDQPRVEKKQENK